MDGTRRNQGTDLEDAMSAMTTVPYQSGQEYISTLELGNLTFGNGDRLSQLMWSYVRLGSST